jgi:hypothetical protein
MTDRCEPPEHLRDRDGPHWVQKGDTAPILIEWEMPEWWPETGGAWRIGRHAVVPAAAYKHGYRYLCPVATPAEVEALRRDGIEVRRFTAEEDAAILAMRQQGLGARRIGNALTPPRPQGSITYRLLTLARREARAEAHDA